MHMKRISTLVLIALLFAGIKSSLAQTVLSESFDGVTFPPLGWNMGKIDTSSDANNTCERVTASSNPVSGGTHTGLGMARYRSGYMTFAGDKFFLASKPLDMRSIPAGGATCTFWMYRENATLGVNDSVAVYVNDSASVSFYIGAAGPVSCTNLAITQIAPAAGPMANISRPYNSNPILGAAGWTQYSVTIPNTWNTTNVYLVFVFTNRHAAASGGNIYIDDVVMNTYPQAQQYISSAIFLQDASNVAQNSTNDLIIGCKVTILGGGDPLVAGQQITISAAPGMQFNTNGTTSPATDLSANSAKLWWTGGTNSFTGTANAVQVGVGQNPWVTNYSFTSATFKFDNGDNYFWITYDCPISAISGNCMDAEYIGIQTTGGTNPGAQVPTAFSIGGCRTIDVVYCGGTTPQYTVGTSWLGGSYTNNDYVQSVILAGDVAPGINNNWNCCGPQFINGSFWGGCPTQFTAHPPDYEKMLASTLSPCTPFAPVHTNVTATLTSAAAPQSYNVTYQCGTWFSSNYIAGFIDFNHNGVLNDASVGGAGTSGPEKIFQSGSMSSNQVNTASFIVPYGGVGPTAVYLGATTFRIREWYAQSNIDPCSPGYYGEVEDYTVVIVPQCGALMPPGFNKLWLGGFDNNWANPQNWCPNNPPTIAENTLIPGSSINRPMIKNGTSAFAKKLRVDGNDTLYINCPTAGGLTVNDSLNINTASSSVRVINAFADTAVLSNGVLLSTPNQNLYNGAYYRQRSQLVYSQAELLAQGMIAGDQIDELWMILRTRAAAANPTYNITVNYFYTSVGYCFNGSFPALAPVAIAGGTAFSGPVNLVSQVPVSTPGQYKLPLTTPITWNGSATSLVIEICYNDAVSQGGDAMYVTQALGCKNYLQVGSLTVASGAAGTPTSIQGCSFTPTIKYNITAGAAGTNTITVGGSTQGLLSNVVPGMLATASLGGIAAGAYVTNVNTGTGVVTLSANNTGAVSGVVTFSIQNSNVADAACTSDKRPNITFKFHRPYGVAPINVAGHWGNNGTFVPGYSNVTFNGTIGNQNIDGTVNTKFYNLTINTSSNIQTVKLNTVADTITNLLALTRGRYVLNGNPTPAIRTTHLTNGLLAGLTYVSGQGMLQAESGSPNYGLFHWLIGTPPAYPTTYVIPFATTTGVQVPVDYKANAGTHDLTLTTYNTIAANTPIPTGVQNINQSTWIAAPGTNNSAYMVDRFWQINNTGTGANVDLTLRYSTAGPNENAGSGAGAYSAQYYDPCGGPNCGWNYPYLPGQSNGANSVTIPNVTYTNTWALSRNPQPLPVELVDFSAKAEKDKVRLTWSTASEVNNDYFTVERTSNNSDFDFISRVESQSRGKVSSGILDYYTYDYKPLTGLQYYRLKQTDMDGKSSFSRLVPIEFGKKQAFEIKTVMNSSDGAVIVYFAYDTDAPVSYKLVDLMGKTVLEGKINASEGLNQLNIDGSLISRGVYNLMLTDANRMVSRKLVPNSTK